MKMLSDATQTTQTANYGVSSLSKNGPKYNFRKLESLRTFEEQTHNANALSTCLLLT